VHVGGPFPKAVRNARAAHRWSAKTGSHIYVVPGAPINDIVHEAVHSATYMLYHHDVDDEEMLAYLTAHIVDVVLEAVALEPDMR